MKLYTRTGDDGTTGLFGGQRVGKDHPRIDACGAIDELNASIGLALCALDARPGVTSPRGTPVSESRSIDHLLRGILTALQSRLFDLGADVATPSASKHEAKIARIEQAAIDQAERWIDQIDGGNEPMTHFVLPGGTEIAARLHLARTIGRRAERCLVALARVEPVNPLGIVLANRISDLLFAMARRANREAGVPDVKWIPGGAGRAGVSAVAPDDGAGT